MSKDIVVTLDAGQPVKIPNTRHAQVLAPFIFSDRQRNTLGVQYLNAVAAVGRVADLDIFDESIDRKKVRETIGEAVAVLLDVHIRTKNAQHTVSVMPDDRWCNRGPDRDVQQVRAALFRTLERSTLLAARTRDRLMVIPPEERLSPLQWKSLPARQKAKDDAKADCLATERMISDAAAIILWDSNGSPSLYEVAAYWKLSLRECFEAFADTKHAMLAKMCERWS